MLITYLQYLTLKKCNKFFRKINDLHPNLKYTDEKTKKWSLLILDFRIPTMNTNLDTFVYRKPTNTNIVTNWKYNTPNV